ncbi:MAG: restriction endonuclease [Actinobacteria bacterium]|nr:restriction endonuclease [Actinomycetota bacterium]
MEPFEDAVLSCWRLRRAAASKARAGGSKDPGLRAGVTSGAHLDPLTDLVTATFTEAGIPDYAIWKGRSRLDLPGYFRAEKRWDIVVVHGGELVAAVEFKSQFGSFGNNLNNCAEEALGNATDLQQAAEQGLLGRTAPWLGYVYLMQDEPKSRAPVAVTESHFRVDREFKDASYQERAMLLCRRLVLKRLYDAACFAVADPEAGVVCQPADDLTWARFQAAVRGRVGEILA